MIIEALLNIIFGFVNLIFSILPNIPKIDSAVFNSIFEYIAFLIDSASKIANIFLPMDLLKILLPLLIVIYFFEPIYKLIMWILRKLPFLNIN